MFAKALVARLIAVLLTGTLVSAPFSCCCAQTESQALEAFAHATMSHGVPAGQMPGKDHLCPHKLTGIDSGKLITPPAIVHFDKAVVYGVVPDASVAPTAKPAAAGIHIRPPPVRTATLVTQRVLLLI